MTLNYKQAMKQAKAYIFNYEARHADNEAYAELIKGLERYRHVKRLNRKHCDEIMDGAKSPLRGIHVEVKDWFKGVFSWTFERETMDEHTNKIDKGFAGDDIKYLEDLSGEAIYQKVIADFIERPRYVAPQFTLLDFELFFADLNLLESKHACADRALGYLMRR